MVTLGELKNKKGMFYVPEAYKKYGMHTKTENLIGKTFYMVEPPIVRKRPSKEQPPEGQNMKEDGSKIVWFTQTAYIPIQLEDKSMILITNSIDLIKQFAGIERDELQDPEFQDSILYFYQDKIEGPLKIGKTRPDGKKYDVAVLEDA